MRTKHAASAVLCALSLALAGGSLGAPSSVAAEAFAEEAKLLISVKDEYPGGVALSKDGSTGLAGPWILRRRGNELVRAQKLTVRASSRVGYSKSKWSTPAALSANGSVALLGNFNHDNGKGGAWAFRRTGGTWVGSQLKPTGMKGHAEFGESVALSADGRIAVVGGPDDDRNTLSFRPKGKGAVWVFSWTGSRWLQRAKLTPGGASGRPELGTSVALSADGTTVLGGGPLDNDGNGAVWTFVDSGGRWKQSGTPLRRSKTSNSRFGSSVAVSADGSTALVGGPREERHGSAYVFTRSGATWSQQARLRGTVPPRSTAGFGQTVSLSGDGSTAIVGEYYGLARPGYAVVFVRSGTTWSQQTPSLTRGYRWFGTAVALAPDGGRALVTGTHRAFKWGIWMFVNPPTVNAVNPLRGPTGGGTTVTIDGRGFSGVRGVSFGATPAASYTVESPVRITAVSPPGAAGTVDVTVRTSVATSAGSPAARFTYVNRPAVSGLTPASGPPSGGTSVRIAGSDFLGATEVRFGTVEAQFKIDDATQITAVAPPGQGTVDVTVTTPGGTSATGAGARFSYVVPVTVVNFDNLTTGGPGQTVVPVTTQYAAQGVTFNGPSAVDYSKGTAIPGFTRSGTVAVEHCVGVEFCTTPIRGTFATPKSMVRVWIGFSFQLNQPLQVQLRALNGSGGVLGTASTTLPARPTPTPIAIALEVRPGGTSIAQFEVLVPGGYNNALAVDDVTFEG